MKGGRKQMELDINFWESTIVGFALGLSVSAFIVVVF